MGGSSSKPQTPQQVYRPPPSPVVNESEKLLDKPWRDIEWTAVRKEKLLNEIKRYKPSVSSVKQARILLVGPIGVGKSSFFNSINSVFHGHITSQAVTGTTLESSVTLKFRTYQVEAGQNGEPLPFILCDTMGLEEGLAQGLNIEDIPNILNGKIGDRYQFNPVSPLEDSNSRNPEKLEDKIHCVVYVLDVSKMGLIPEKLIDKIRAVRKKVNEFAVPQVLLLTKVDQTCPPVEKDIQKVYHSVYLQAKIKDASARLGIPLLSVFPVKNYTREVELQQNDDILLLSALQKILHFADDYMRDMNDKKLIRRLEEPWRKIVWKSEKKNELINEIKRYKPSINSVSQARILLVGPVGAGKSSFFNSISSVFHGYVTNQAISGNSGDGVTTQLLPFRIKAGEDGKPLSFIVCDTMGLKAAPGEGVHVEDICNILKGHVPDRYKLNTASPLKEDDPQFDKSVKLQNKIHCVVYVIDASKVTDMPEQLMKKIAAIRQNANEIGVPQLLILTKVDEACIYVKKDIQYVYRSPYIKKKIHEASDQLGIPVSCIFPVKNYTHETDLEENCDILLLSILQQILRFANNYFDSIYD
ncbi:uncharacterized protein LOC108934051 [Scleropages formosus]|uniref:uncharacterized protein LOC108934051 n=1 Tax=Scleropages formosus TaxID=113540 RepID=UPI0010FA76B5|nr:uncharacterized protein LOC108934051 [Scleropages formosus]